MPLKKGDIKVGDRVVFVGPSNSITPPIGTVGVFIGDDGSDCPRFKFMVDDGCGGYDSKEIYCSYFRLERANRTHADVIISQGVNGLAKLFELACPPDTKCNPDVNCKECIRNWLEAEAE